MKKIIISILFLALFSSSCRQKLNADRIEWKEGLKIDIQTGKPLTGKYKSITPIGGTYNGDHLSTFEYKKGVPVGEWTYTFNGDPIQNGIYLEEELLKLKISKMTNSLRTDIDLWKEGGFPLLSINLIIPEETDSNTLVQIISIVKNELLNRQKFHAIFINSNNGIESNEIYRFKMN